MKTLIIAAGFAAALIAPAFGQTNLVSNGSFESTSFAGDAVAVRSGETLGAWTVTSGTVDLIGTMWTASSGRYSVDMAGISNGAISQIIGTTAGQTYDLSFDMASNPGGPAIKTFRVDVGTDQATFQFDSTGHNESNMGWTTRSLSFVASGPTTLTFTSQAADGFHGIALDNVAVVASVPEPETYAMLLAGLGLIGFIARRREVRTLGECPCVS